MTKRNLKRLAVIFLVPLGFTISQCFHKTDQPATTAAAAPTDPRGIQYAGSATCIKCHANLADNYFHTNHFQTSRPATFESVHGNFNQGSNVVQYGGNTLVVMEKNSQMMAQSTYVNGVLTRRQPFEIVFGAKQAETYLYWNGPYVFELPVTYYKNLHQWANSPGLDGDNPIYTRLINEPCFECHSSYIKQIPPTREEAAQRLVGQDKSTMLLGIDCERCHGGAASHVNFQTQNPKVKTAMYITSISKLTRPQRMDMCAQCHSGINENNWSTFDFKPGDDLSKYKNPQYAVKPSLKKVDVHGNQVGLISGSQCFIKGKLECGSCHNQHASEVVSTKIYSQMCTNCHANPKHSFGTMTAQLSEAIKSNCIDCHMPVKSSAAIQLFTEGNKLSHPFNARMHRITVYPEETKKVLAMLKKDAGKSIVN